MYKKLWVVKHLYLGSTGNTYVHLFFTFLNLSIYTSRIRVPTKDRKIWKGQTTLALEEFIFFTIVGRDPNNLEIGGCFPRKQISMQEVHWVVSWNQYLKKRRVGKGKERKGREGSLWVRGRIWAATYFKGNIKWSHIKCSNSPMLGWGDWLFICFYWSVSGCEILDKVE